MFWLVDGGCSRRDGGGGGKAVTLVICTEGTTDR